MREAFANNSCHEYGGLNFDLPSINLALDLREAHAALYNALNVVGLIHPNTGIYFDQLITELIGDVTCEILNNPIQPELDYLSDAVSSFIIFDDIEYDQKYVDGSRYLITLPCIRDSLANGISYNEVRSVYEALCFILAEKIYYILPVIQTKVLSIIHHIKIDDAPFYLDYQSHGVSKTTEGYWLHITHCFDMDVFAYQCDSIEDPYPGEPRKIVEINKYFQPFNYLRI